MKRPNATRNSRASPASLHRVQNTVLPTAYINRGSQKYCFGHYLFSVSSQEVARGRSSGGAHRSPPSPAMGAQ